MQTSQSIVGLPLHHNVYINETRTVLVQTYDGGRTVEVALRETQNQTWGPPVHCEPEGGSPDGQKPSWEPGTLGTLELEQILMDALADLWRDAFRREQHPNAQLRLFRRTVESALYSATGREIWLSTERQERG